MSTATPLHHREPEENADLFDYALIRDWIGYALRSFRRHPWAALLVMVFGGAVTVGSLKALPRTYHVETRLLAQQNQVMNSLDNPNRNLPYDPNGPTRAASETVLRRDNLILLIKQTDLIDVWEHSRAPAVRLKDALMELILGKPTEEDRMEGLVGLLEKRLTVETGDQTVTIAIDWPDAQTAFRLVDAAQQNFLETRHVTEIAVISEAISILEGHAAQVHDAIASTMDDLQRALPQPEPEHAEKDKAKPRDKEKAPPRRPAPPIISHRLGGDDQETAQLKVLLSSKKQTIKDVEEFRQRRLTELQGQLAEAKAIYSVAHPTVVNIQQTIDALSNESPQVTQLKKDCAELDDELKKRDIAQDIKPPPAVTAPAEASAHRDVEDAIKLTRKPTSEGEDLSVEYERSRLRLAIEQYDSLLQRIDAARIELDTARAAFKYRYSVIRPAQVPKDPVKPKPALVLAGGALVSLLLGLTTALLIDLRSGRIVERWQVERLLEVPVLGEVHRA